MRTITDPNEQGWISRENAFRGEAEDAVKKYQDAVGLPAEGIALASVALAKALAAIATAELADPGRHSTLRDNVQRQFVAVAQRAGKETEARQVTGAIDTLRREYNETSQGR